MYFDLHHLRTYGELDGKTFLICVGAMKSATSWTHDYLSDLPDVVVSPLKELHFFNTKYPSHALGDMDGMALNRLKFHLEQKGDTADNLRRRETFQASLDRAQMIYDDNAYFAHFARLVEADTRTFCDITPAYSVLGPTGFEYLREFCASQNVTLKLLFIMRDPVDRMWSQLRHMAQTSLQSDFLDNWAKAFASPSICARADYCGIVSDLDKNFDAEDVLYLFYEDLFSEASLRQLCDHANAPYSPGDAGKTHNETKVKTPISAEALTDAKALLAPQYAFCRERFGDRVPASWQG